SWSRRGRHTSSPDEDVAKSRNGSRRPHPYQEEMMRMSRGRTGLRAAAIALGLIAWCAPGAAASATNSTNSNFGLMNYSTTGNVSYAQGVQGNNVISYISLQDAVSDPSSNVDLGYFKVAPNAPGAITTYTNTPFSIVFQPSGYSGHDLTNPGAVTLSGVLNGKVTGSSQSTVQATFNSTGSGAFTLSSGTAPDSTLSMLQNQKLLLVPSSTGLTSLTPGGLT